MRHSLNYKIISLPLLNITLFNYSSFSTSSFITTLITTKACYLLGFSLLSYYIMHTSTLFSMLNLSITNLLTFLLSISITSVTLIKSTLTRYYLGPTSLTLGIYRSSYLAIICQNTPSLSLSTENLIMLMLLFTCHTQKSLTIALANYSMLFMPYQIACLTASIVATLLATSSLTLLTLITIYLLSSLYIIPKFINYISAIPSLATYLLAVTPTYISINYSLIKGVLSYTQSC